MEINNSNMSKAHEELLDIFKKKNSDYGNSFEKSLQEHGIIAAIVRMEDKMSRLSNLSNNKSNQKVNNESIIDTLKDLSNYALMTAVWLEPIELIEHSYESYSLKPKKESKIESFINDIQLNLYNNVELITTNRKYITFSVKNFKAFKEWFDNYIKDHPYYHYTYYTYISNDIVDVAVILKD
nr:MAG TPA: Nucleotide modification associated domain 1 [Caudoviricetes sp.]